MRTFMITALLPLVVACFSSGAQAAGEPAATQPSPLVPRVEGADLSKWQGVADFSQWAGAGKAFVFLKATQGASAIDPDHQKNALAARAAGLLVGAYHYYVPADSADAQFANLRRQAPPRPGDLPPVVDVEILSPGSPTELAAQLRPFLQLIETEYGVKPIVYSGRDFATAHLADLSAYPLWLAEYTERAAPQLPPYWARWAFWQYTDSGSVVGVAGKLDLDRFNGTLQDLKAMLQR